jgi:ADP-heptose:LPS heptosyltransferase
MSIKGLRFLDFWVGLPLTWLLTVFAKTLGRFAKIPPGSRRVLFVKFSEQGSTVIARQILHLAAETYGRENIYFTVFKENQEILRILDIVPPQNILTVETGNIFVIAKSLLRVLGTARAKNIDTVIDLEFTSRASALLAYLTGAKKRVGLHTFFDEGPYRGDLFTHRVQFNPQIHTSSLYLALFASHLADPNVLPLTKFKLKDLQVETPPHLRFDAAEEAHVLKTLETELKAKLQPEDLVILLNVNASDLVPIRKWPESHFTGLAGRLLAAYPQAYLIFTGNKQEEAATGRIAASLKSDRAVSLAGKLSLREFIVLLSQSDLLISNDSGPAHFSSLTDIHRIVLFGPETPNLFSPLGKNLSVVYEPMACSPCVSAYNHRHSRCTDNVCMKSITVDRVFEEARAVIEKLNARPQAKNL